jgi:uncharacterized protein YbjT (DUF2867 family)
MARVLIVGATGGVGLRLARRLVAEGHVVLGLSRTEEGDRSLTSFGAWPVRGDLISTTVEEFAALLGGADAVVFTAGAGGGDADKTDLIDGEGVVKLAAAAEAAGVSRFLLVSAFPDAWRDRRMPADFEHYMFVKRQADVHLAGTALDWIILRPGTLLDAQGSGRVRIGPAIPYGDVSRDDVAAVLASLLGRPDLTRVILELTEGEQEVEAALDRLT